MAEQPDEMTIALPAPVAAPGGDPVTEIRLRAPTAREWRDANRLPGVEGDIALVSSVSGVPKGAVELMPAYIVNRGARYMLGFFDPPQETETAS